jgi:diguanylate cyclase (GGDEF)-like protein
MTISLPGYRVAGLVHESNRSRIYRGTRLADGGAVMLKTVREDALAPQQRARIEREYRLLRSLDLEGVVAVCALESVGGIPVMVMQDCGCTSLAKLGVAGALALDEWLDLAILVVRCVGQLHGRRIMHKDINPSNIIWNRRSGLVKLIDLGLAAELLREASQPAPAEQIEGTLAYLSPEQTGRMNRAVDYRTDFYSLGVTFYQLLTGRLPFAAGDALEMVHAHIAKAPVPAHQVDPQVPPVLSALVDKLMAKTAEDRYQSAAGIEADLLACRSRLAAGGRIDDFPLGANDFPPRLQVPQKLYGRQAQREALLQAFRRAGQGNGELVLVAGYSGVGKSALVHEIQKPLLQQRGYFTEGKFEQYNRDVPYAALIQAFGGLIRQLLIEDEAAVARHRERVQRAAGANGRVLADVIPELLLLIGPQPPVPALPAAQAQHRFNFEFRRFAEAIASAEHPLAVFLDDLQWADLPSLQLLALLLQPPAVPHLLLIGAYRDNEVGPAHALMLTLQQLHGAGAALQTLQLLPLGKEEIGQLLGDALRCPPDEVAPLARLCLAKTHGNPFFLNQFLATLVEQELLYPDPVRGRWAWKLGAIEQAGFTDNIVQLMVGKLHRLPPQVLHSLQCAACLGHAFDLKTLAAVQAIAPQEAVGRLWEALSEELIVPLDGGYKYVGYASVDNAGYRFLHDQVHQAAYQSSSESERHAIHLSIARLWEASGGVEAGASLFDLVNHYNHARGLLTDPAERDRVAQLNVQAGRRAKAASAYGPALRYYRSALELLDEAAWQDRYEATLATHLEAAAVAHLSADRDGMQALLDRVSSHARSILDRVQAHAIRIQADIAQDRFADALQLGLRTLDMLGVRFPARAGPPHVVWELVKTRWALRGRKVESLAGLPPMADARVLAASDILDKIGPAASYVAPVYMSLALLKCVQLSLRCGISPLSATPYAAFGMVVGSLLGNVPQGVRFGDLALKLQERPEAAMNQCRTAWVVHAMIWPWCRPLADTLEPIRQDYLKGTEIGDIEFAANAAMCVALHAFYAGRDLPEVEQAAASYGEAARMLQRPSVHNLLRVLRQTVLNLQGRAADPVVLDGEACLRDEVHQMAMAKDALLRQHLAVMQLMLRYLFGDHAGALQSAEQLERDRQASVPYFTIAIQCFYDALTRAAHLNRAMPWERLALLRKIVLNARRLRRWARHAPSSFLNKWHLVQAERLRHASRGGMRAMHHYQQAIALALDNGLLLEAALAHELAAGFHLARGHEAVAKGHLREAQRCYFRCGAAAKARNLLDRYPQWLRDQATDWPSGSGSTTLGHSASVQTGQIDALDFATVLKSLQALSEEIVLPRLLKRLLQVVIESAGAQRGVILLRKGEQWWIEAEKSADAADALIFDSLLLDEVNAVDRLPLALVRYVTHTGDGMIVGDAGKDRLLAGDAYVGQRRALSMLAMPIRHRHDLVGLIYLENNALADAFTEGRLEMLKLLAAQAAISIANARLYAEMEERVAARTAELRAMSLRDALTGVGNRKAFDDRLKEEFTRIRRNGNSLALLLIDIDHFKRINDTYGHPVGDECLRRMGAALLSMDHRPSDFVARYGGEEFAFLLADTGLQGAAAFAERVLDAVRHMVLEIGAVRHPVTASIGVATATRDTVRDAAALVECADRCLYMAKQAGRDRVVSEEGGGRLP